MIHLEELKKNSGFFTVIVVAIILTLLAGFFVIRSIYASLKRVNQEVSQNQIVLSAYEKKINDLALFKQNYIDLEQEVPDFRKYILGTLPSSSEEERYAVAFKNLADRAGLNLKGITFSPSTSATGVQALTVNFQIDSISYPTLFRFWDLLYASSRLNTVKNMTLTSSGFIVSGLSFEVYYQPTTGGV